VWNTKYEDLADFDYTNLTVPAEIQQVTKINVKQYLGHPDCTGEGWSRLPGITDH
jgi:hypothetical protein